jgi:hypothetical protein
VPWFRVDDVLADHPKVIMAGNAAMGLWVRAGAWSMKHLTDGFIPDAVASILGTAKEADALVRVGLWTVSAGGYTFHAWEGRQPTKNEVEDRRSKRAEAGRKGGLKSGESRREAKSEANASLRVEANANPRPVPSQTDIANPRQASHEANAHESDDDPTVVAAQGLGIKSLTRVRSAFGDLLDADASDGEVVDAAAAVLERSRTFVKAPEAYIEKAVKESRYEVGLYAQDAQARSPRRMAATA